MGERENDSGSHCNSSWKLGPLIGIYTTPCCRALFYLDPVASFFGKLKASFSSAGFSGSPLWPFALFECYIFLLPEGSNVSIPVFPHSMFCWIALLTDRSQIGQKSPFKAKVGFQLP